MRQPGEPSVEEILESIKRVIAREDRGERPTRLHMPRAHPDDAAATIGTTGTAASPPGGIAATATARDDVFDLAGHQQAGDQGGQPMATVPLVTDSASHGMRDALDMLAAASAPAPAAAPAMTADGALEPLVRELLRPALSDWLDRNLPAIVERLVAAEIARIAGRRG